MKASHLTLGILLALNVTNHIDRQIMNILVEPVKRDLALDDAQIGWLIGGAFALFYTVAGIPIARLADRGNRRNLIAIALVIWSGMTVACGFARNFAQLLCARIGVAIGEAGCTPPAHSMLSDSFPPERRGTAISIYAVGVPIGTLVGMAFGGYLTDQLGWQRAFWIVGAPGLLLALVVRFALVEPPRGAFDAAGESSQMESLGNTLRFMGGMASVRHMLMAASVQTLCTAGLGAFNASFLVRVHGLTLTEAGIQLGLIAGLIGGASVLLAGRLADRLGARDLRWHWWVPGIGALASIPFSVGAYTAESASLAVGLLAIGSFGNHMYSALGHVVLQALAKPRMRALTSACALFCMNLVGYGLGPIVLGLLSELFGGGVGIRYALLALLSCLVWSSLHFLLGARSYRSDLALRNA
jgi:predicted MFS family arabinose efflux permease